MTSTEILRYTAFSTDPAGGNPAGIVLDAAHLTDDEMLAIAADVGYSETAFVTANIGDNFTVRYFSPLAEVPFCGHATIATAVAIADRRGAGDVVFETKAGRIPVSVRAREGVLQATLTSVEPSVHEVDDLAGALDALRWSESDLDPGFPPRIAFAGARHLVLAASTRDRLARLDYDFDALAEWMTARDLTTVQLVWRESDTVFHVRDPFPIGGVVEDPATGAAAAAFGGYLRELGLVGPDAELTLHQGVDLGRPSLLLVSLTSPERGVRVTGSAVPL